MQPAGYTAGIWRRRIGCFSEAAEPATKVLADFRRAQGRGGSTPLLSIELFPRAAALFHAFSMEQFENFLADESGQDLIEYTLLMSFVALASAALFAGAGRSVKGIWSSSNSQLTAANTSAS